MNLAKFSCGLACGIFVTAFAGPALAHDHWINHGGYRNKAGEHCCGGEDCAALDPGAVRSTASGYTVKGYGTINGIMGRLSSRVQIEEIVPYSEVQRSRDGRFWRCQRADGSRRCFFAPDQMM